MMILKILSLLLLNEKSASDMKVSHEEKLFNENEK
jgi:hypothetical protein